MEKLHLTFTFHSFSLKEDYLAHFLTKGGVSQHPCSECTREAPDSPMHALGLITHYYKGNSSCQCALSGLNADSCVILI